MVALPIPALRATSSMLVLRNPCVRYSASAASRMRTPTSSVSGSSSISFSRVLVLSAAVMVIARPD
ncbi:MAG TPA: hypothetical protein VFX16_11975 [Pseudonocardiaceae bacterium]|nr:hypothetical protein [Pseudonocardiaceae bacterium]